MSTPRTKPANDKSKRPRRPQSNIMKRPPGVSKIDWRWLAPLLALDRKLYGDAR